MAKTEKWWEGLESNPETREALLSTFTIDLPALYSDTREPGFLVDQLVPDTGVFLLTGKPGIGKSWVAYDLIRAVSTGTPWLGRSAPACDGQPMPVLLLDYDNGAINIRSRFTALALPATAPVRVHIEEIARMKKFLGRPGYSLRIPIDKLATTGEDPDKVLEIIQALIDQSDARLVVFDSMRQAHTGDENESSVAGYMMSIFKSIAYPLGENVNRRLIMLVHHTAKSGGRSRGSSEIEGSADVIVELKRMIDKGEEKLMLVWDKVRAWKLDKYAFRVSIDQLKKSSGDLTFVRAIDRLPGADEAKYVALVRAVEEILREGRRGKRGSGKGKKPYMGFNEIQKQLKAKKIEISRKGEFEDVVMKGVSMGLFYDLKPSSYSSQKALMLGRRPEPEPK